MPLTLEQVQQFLYREARFLDDRDFDAWLALYAPDVEFWMPSWDDDDQLVTDPQTDVSLIYYDSRCGLEDRVFRIRTERSSATSLPEPRTSHNISNVEILEQDETSCNSASTGSPSTTATRRWIPISARRSTPSTPAARPR